MTLVTDGEAGFHQDHHDRWVVSTAMGFYSVGERLGPTPNTT